MDTLLQAIINGLMVGGIYAMIGMSLNIIFGVMKIVNFCQGEILMLGMYVSFVLFDKGGLDPFVAIPIVAVIMFLFGALIQMVLITRSMNGSNDSNVLFLTVGLGILFSNSALLFFKSDYRTAKSIFTDNVLHFGNLNISLPKLVSLIIVLIITGLLFALLKYTKIGKQIRATSQNQIGAQVSGIKTKTIYAVTYGLGAAIAGITGACLMSFYYVYPTVGNIYGTRSFIVVTMGGLGSVLGAFFGGIVLGLLETISAMVVGSSLKDTVVFLVFIIILVVKQNLTVRKQRG